MCHAFQKNSQSRIQQLLCIPSFFLERFLLQKYVFFLRIPIAALAFLLPSTILGTAATVHSQLSYDNPLSLPSATPVHSTVLQQPQHFLYHPQPLLLQLRFILTCPIAAPLRFILTCPIAAPTSPVPLTTTITALKSGFLLGDLAQDQ